MDPVSSTGLQEYKQNFCQCTSIHTYAVIQLRNIKYKLSSFVMAINYESTSKDFQKKYMR